jgi:hypothetical protein
VELVGAAADGCPDGDGAVGATADGAVAGAAAVASSRAAKGESSCWLKPEACDCCDASARVALYSGVILGVLDTAALPETNLNSRSRVQPAGQRRCSKKNQAGSMY